MLPLLPSEIKYIRRINASNYIHEKISWVTGRQEESHRAQRGGSERSEQGGAPKKKPDAHRTKKERGAPA